MNSLVLQKINEIKKMATSANAEYSSSVSNNKKSTDGLSRAIHSKRDADTFLNELKAIRKQRK